MPGKLKIIILMMCSFYISTSCANENNWVRDSVYKCEGDYTVSFHQTDHVNKVALLKNDIIISSLSDPHQDNIVSLDGISITSTDLNDTSGYKEMTEEQRLKKYIENKSYSFIFENPLLGKNKNNPRTGLVISKLGNYELLSCNAKK
ncbi:MULTISPECIES: hypothetical protein [unclassified Pantoea]|uniref:hypothetical protein n=1 Tax=unclassified Pantoea TaxID=2630326 RepID=UPI001CD685C3|nr:MULTISPECIES: hypothetical protein [unclassified Pantoea]MCA1179518.1 hypothetical protein [Pantoea sp. alder69]MCA1251771.1 hypothetical protein [Pantoea sp. alder70]MCA1267892.1 hypothetical protein [Pantoea sp. alder81]